MAKKELDNKKEFARILYMNGENQQDIADKTGVSRVTINKWIKENGWKERRAAKAVTRPELINKILLSIDTMIDKANNLESPEAMAGLGDKLSKLASVIEKLDKKAIQKLLVAVIFINISYNLLNHLNAGVILAKEKQISIIKINQGF